MTRVFHYTITNSNSQDILGFLKDRGYSHGIITHLKQTTAGIQKNGVWARTRDLLKQGDVLTITLKEEEGSSTILPVALPLHIVYEDDDLLVIDKPSNMPVHPSQGNHDNTLGNALAYYFLQKNEVFTYRCINRLDRDTTGLLIVARHMLSASLLSVMVRNHSIHREYLALAKGLVPPFGVINAPIGRVPGSTIERQINYSGGEYACTRFTRLHYKKGYSLVSLLLETGRTHQIRVHMKSIGHPLPGDFLYNPDYTIIDRQALHSHKLSFVHPITQQPLTFCSPLPQDMCL